MTLLSFVQGKLLPIFLYFPIKYYFVSMKLSFDMFKLCLASDFIYFVPVKRSPQMYDSFVKGLKEATLMGKLLFIRNCATVYSDNVLLQNSLVLQLEKKKQ